MATYRKKPVVIQAWQFENDPTPFHWYFDASVKWWSVPGGLFIETLEGTMRADVGDWIIQGVKSEYYPCKPDIFAATYEYVE